MKDKVCIIGGLGRIGLTLAAILNPEKYDVHVCDINEKAKKLYVEQKKAVFDEPGLNAILKRSDIRIIADNSELLNMKCIVITIGTPVDEYMNPKLSDVIKCMEFYAPYIAEGTVIMLRSTIYPGTTQKIKKLFSEKYNKNIHAVFCPERIMGGKMVEELLKLPQIIASEDEIALAYATDFFSYTKVKQMKNSVAGELAKLYTNAYRYMHFAIANQFFMIAEDNGIDFYDIYDAITFEYPRMKNFPTPGFTSGYCLRKDTLQLCAWKNYFNLGYDASLVNEGIPFFIARKLREKYPNSLSKMVVGLLGMSFKPETDDSRDSLAFRMKKILQNECKEVLINDPYVDLSSYKENAQLSDMLERCDLFILTCPHESYEFIKTEKPIVDIWNFYKQGVGL